MIIVTVRPGVQFVPDAAAAFRRAEAQVIAELGRPIDVNSTYRSWADQMIMFTNWQRWISGKGPKPNHSKAVHPSESFHVDGLALDSDDWRNARVVAILAENGFIRNRLHVPGEQHHFEYIRSRDRNYGTPVAGGSVAPIPIREEYDMRFIKAAIDGITRYALVTLGKGQETTDVKQANLWAQTFGDAKAVTKEAYKEAIENVARL